MLSTRALAAVALAVSTLAGCGIFGKNNPEIQRWSGMLSDLRVHWSAEPGIDLLQGPAVPLRAYIESFELVEATDDLRYAYTGFEDAVAPSAPWDSPDVAAHYRRPASRAVPLESGRVGNEYYHILSVTHDGQDVAATVCNYFYAVATQQDDGRYYSIARSAVQEPRGISAQRVFMVAPQDDSASLPPQKGPAPAPENDVFGNWQITGNLIVFSADEPRFKELWPTYDADTARCVEKAPDPPERREFLLNGVHPRTDFPTTPASPGWPEGET